MFPQTPIDKYPGISSGVNTNQQNPFGLLRKINGEKDLIHFRSFSPAYKNILKFVNLLTDHILGTNNRVLNSKYTLQHPIFQKCDKFLKKLAEICDETDLNTAQNAGYIRFGHLAFRDWFDVMKKKSIEFVDSLSTDESTKNYKQELLCYLSESFGNRSRIDYGTGHELNFVIFLMGLIFLVNDEKGFVQDESHIDANTLTQYVKKHGWDILDIMAHSYLTLCRCVQKKFRLEPAGSRGVYNMDDFQYLPFLFGAAQLVGQKYISASNFFDRDQVDMYKSEFIFIEAVDYILETKRGPFNEHSYTLWEYSNLGSWENILRRIKNKFVDEVLKPFPIVQHLLFGIYIFRWIGEPTKATAKDQASNHNEKIDLTKAYS